MPTPLAEAFVRVRADTRQFKTEATKGIEGANLGKHGEKQGKAFGSAFAGGLKGLSAAIAGLGIASVFTGFVNDARESAKIGRITEQVVRSTGKAAKVSAEQVGDLAAAISNKTGKDDEAIQAGQNLLLTFTNIRNETGKGNDIFNQASQAIVDMTAALNNGEVTASGMKSSSIQLGKALNDPIKGVTALSKVGVSFTAEQKKQIKTLTESGNVMAAQKIILKELGKEFGGAAAASTDPLERLRVVVGNLGEKVGGQLLPHIDRLATWFGDRAAPAIAKFLDGMQTGVGAGGQFAAALAKVASSAKSTAEFIERNKDVLIPAVAAIGSAIVVVKAITVASKAWAAAQAALNVVMSANPIALVVLALAGLAAGLIYAYKHSETFRRIVDGAFRGIASAAKWAWDSVIKPALTAMSWYIRNIVGPTCLWVWRSVVQPAFKGIGEAAKFMWNNVLKPTFKFLVSAWLTVAGAIINGAAKAFGWVPGLGPKLQTAAREFGKFRDSVNRSLGGVRDRSVTVTANLVGTAAGVVMTTRTRTGRRIVDVSAARGMLVPGPPSNRDNRIAAVATGEYIVNAKQTSKHLPVLEAINAGRFEGFATGGFVPRASTASGQQVNYIGGRFDKQVALAASEVAQHVRKHVRGALAGGGAGGWTGGGDPSRRTHFRGHAFNERTVKMLLAAERILGATFNITQGSYSTSVSASGGTHAGGGAVDIGNPTSAAAQTAMRRAGFAAWIRTPAQGPWGRHIHAIAIGDPTLSGAARRQVASFRRGGNGLAGMAAGGRVASYDQGGYLPPGLSMAYNGTGRPERVVPAAAGGGTYHFHLHGPVGSRMELENWLVKSLDSLRGQGRI